ncbi:MAG: ATP-grasp fold amidoligase family protein [Pseudolabrys sp.]
MHTESDIEEKVQIAISLHNQGKLIAAKKIYEDVVALNPRHFNALQLLGLVSYQIGEFDRAVALILNAIAINGTFAFAHKTLGNAFEQLNRLDEALASYDRAISLEPDYAVPYVDRGNALKKLDRLDDAIASYNKAISLKHDYADAYNNLGVALNELKRHAEALANFQNAIRLNPNYSQAYHNCDIALADSAQWHLLFQYRAIFGVLPRLNPPVSFNERILHRIIHDRDPKLRIVSDKLAARRLIEERVGAEYVVPLLGVWEHPREITWHTLPEKFVLKPNHSSGPFAIVDQSIGITKEQLSVKAEQWLSYDYFDASLEWGYRGIPRRLLAEPFLNSSDGGPAPEAQVYTFSGKAALINIMVGTKFSHERSGCWFDVTGRRVAVKRRGTPLDLQLSDSDRQKMAEIAARVSQDFSSLRVDFYMTSDGLKIGELTPYPHGGMTKWDPPELDEMLGRLWHPDCDLSIIPDYK